MSPRMPSRDLILRSARRARLEGWATSSPVAVLRDGASRLLRTRQVHVLDMKILFRRYGVIAASAASAAKSATAATMVAARMSRRPSIGYGFQDPAARRAPI